jgi:outer membrane lipoprotein carrier protein
MRAFCWTLIVLLSSSVSWANMPAKSSEKQLFELLNPIDSFSANFNQLLIDQKGQSLQTLSGVLHGQKPDKIYWTVFEPAAQTIVSNGSRLWLYDPDLEQVIIEPYSSNPEANPISLLLGDPNQLSENFKLLQHNNLAGSTLQFLLEPVKLNSLYTLLTLEFKNGFLSAINFADNLGQTTTLVLTEFTLNPVFKDKFFTFQIPLGVDVVNHVH